MAYRNQWCPRPTTSGLLRSFVAEGQALDEELAYSNLKMIQVATSENQHDVSKGNVPDALCNFDRTPQRTENWWKRRANKMSGSKLANLMFVNNVQELATYRLEVIGEKPRPPLDEEAMKRVKWGVDHEPDAGATLLHHIPGIQTWEVGFEMHSKYPWFGSSPDGMVYWPDRFPNNPWGVLEIKCCTKLDKRGKNVPHAGVPYYYIPQLHAEMACMPMHVPCRWCVFVSWSASTSKIYVVKFDENYWKLLWDMVVDFRAGDVDFYQWKLKRDRVKRASEQIAKSATLVQVVQSCCVK